MRTPAKGGPQPQHSFFRKIPANPLGLRSWELRLLLLLAHPHGATRMWAALLNCAIRELRHSDPAVRQDALEWLISDYNHDEVGSFKFVCLQLGLNDPPAILHDVLGRMEEWMTSRNGKSVRAPREAVPKSKGCRAA